MSEIVKRLREIGFRTGKKNGRQMADFYSYRPLPKSIDKDTWREMADIQRKEGATFFRATVVNTAHPSQEYPMGLYLEGWKEQPREQGFFDWPMTYKFPETTHADT